jgi:RNA polymerase sigma-70 factor (ECF subfamily)
VDTPEFESAAEHEVIDDRLRLIFTCCHPALSMEAQIALTLREVCDLKTEEIANAFLTSTATIAQRIVRAKAKIRDAQIPYEVPAREHLPERLDAVLQVIYLVFHEGYAPSTGDQLTRPDLSLEAIRLGRLLLELMSEPEVMGLVALMLLHESRRESRTDDGGEIVLLEEQDRSRWNSQMIAEGQQLVERALTVGQPGAYTLQAAIAAVHASAKTSADTDWAQIAQLYSILARVQRSPIVELNRAVAIAMRDGPAAGLKLIDALMARGELKDYYLAHSAMADLYRRLGQYPQARVAYARALELAKLEPERKFLAKRLKEISR